MWPLLRAELAYRRWLLLGIIPVVMPLAAAYATIMKETAIGGPLGVSLPFLAAWLPTADVVQRYQSERRGRLHILLPVSARQVGLVRVVAAAGPLCAALAVYSLARHLLDPTAHTATTVDQPHPVLRWIFTWRLAWWSSAAGQVWFLAFSLAVAALSVFTLGRRKSYLHA